MNTPKVRGFIAQKKNIIVLLYRKTNKVTYLVHLSYDKKNENITLGSKFYGRIYPNRCDISEDGRYFLYFAMGQSQKKYKKRLTCWTAICKPPLLKAEFLLEHNDTFGGGGRFINQKNIVISPGTSPEFDIEKELNFKNYKINFNSQTQDNGWGSGRDWKLMEHQIDKKLGERYPIPKRWTKTNGQFTLNRKLAYSSFLKTRNGKTQGIFDLYSYSVIEIESNIEIQLNMPEYDCLWADFDNYGRLITSCGSIIMIYKNDTEILNNNPSIKYNLEELTTLPTIV